MMENRNNNDDMHFFEVLSAVMSNDNMNAIKVLDKILELKDKTNKFSSVFRVLEDLDSHRIYGNDIWVLYKNICNEDMKLFFTTLRAFHFNTFSKEEIAEILRENSKGKGGRKFISKDIPINKSVYDAEIDTVGDIDEFEIYLKKQREFFESQQSALGG